MSEIPGSGNESLHPSLARHVDAICNSFEQAWKAGVRPCLEDYLSATPESERPALLRELIALDMAYRRMAGEQPQAEEYLARFPGVVLSAPSAGATAPAPTGATLGAEPPTLPPDVAGPGRASGGPARVFGDYELLEEVARGGMGVVYRARQVHLNRVVALKVILAGQLASEADVQRFRTEAEAAANLDHPHIVPIYEVGEHQEQHYFSMKYIDGGSLADQVPQLVRDPKAAAGLLGTVARAVHHAHQRGILHRDLKPANILLDGQGRPHVTDFGLAKRVEADTGQTRTGAILGTPSYMAPEQARAEKGLSTAADVYSLGAVLYELLTGRPPFRAATPLDTVLQVLEREPERLRSLNATIARDLETICLKCLDKDPRRRYDSAAALADDLERWLRGEPILARPSTAGERVVKWARRRPAAAALVGLTVMVLLGGMTAVLWYADRERARAEQERAQANQERELRQEAEVQRARAVQAEQQAKTNAAEARDVLRFFQDQVLAAARPESQDGGLGIHATIREAVHAAEPKIAGAFHKRPLVEASIRNTLGLTYWYLREGQAAITQHERALALRHDHLGPEHPDTLTSLNNLANAYRATGQLPKALPLYEQALAKGKEKLGPDHPDTVTIMNNLAGVYLRAGQRDKALPLLEQTLAKRKEKLGPDHPHTLNSMNNLALAYKETGQRDKALPLLEQTLAKQKEKLGPDHPDTLTSMGNLAAAYRDAGQRDKALPLLEQTLAKRKEKLGPDHPDTLTSMGNLGETYLALSQPDKAMPLLYAFLAGQGQRLGRDDPRLANIQAAVGKDLLKHEQYAEAEGILAECLKIRAEKQPDEWTTFNTQSLLGGSLAGQKKYAEAEPLLKQGYDGLKQREAKIPPQWRRVRLTEALDRLVQLYDAWGKPDQAARWRAERDKLPKPPEPPKAK
jgi:Tfp pilus assembly protein PilF